MNRKETRRAIPDQWLEPVSIHDWFDSIQNLELDLGCGNGRFLLERATQHPGLNFLGIERQLSRVAKVDHRAIKRNIRNIRLWRVEGDYAMRYLVPKHSISTCYIFFPDPWPKKKHAPKRIMNAGFLKVLHRNLQSRGQVHFATDHLPYFFDAVQAIQGTGLFEEITPFCPTEAERTDFELHFLAHKPIGRYSFHKKT